MTTPPQRSLESFSNHLHLFHNHIAPSTSNNAAHNTHPVNMPEEIRGSGMIPGTFSIGSHRKKFVWMRRLAPVGRFEPLRFRLAHWPQSNDLFLSYSSTFYCLYTRCFEYPFMVFEAPKDNAVFDDVEWLVTPWRLLTLMHGSRRLFCS